jgi:MscS family membrane protein
MVAALENPVLAIRLPLALPIPPFVLAALLAWVGLTLLAGRCRPDGLSRQLLMRGRLSLSSSLLVAGLIWWLLKLLAYAGHRVPAGAWQLPKALVVAGVVWTLLRCKEVVLRHALGNPRLLADRSNRERAFLLDLVGKLISAVVVVFGSLEVMRQLGVSPALLLTASGIGAAAIGFGARTLVENLLSGLMLYVHRPFAVGDEIELPDKRLKGTVQAIGGYYSQLLTSDQQPLYIPNSIFASFPILNASRRQLRRLLVTIPLRPQDRGVAATIAAELQAALHGMPELANDQPRRVHVVGLGAGSLDLQLECFVPGTSEQFYAKQQEVLLLIGEVVERHGAALADPLQSLRPSGGEPGRP